MYHELYVNFLFLLSAVIIKVYFVCFFFRYDWSVITKVAEGHLLDRVIGSKMGREYVDMFSSLLSRNMRSILTNILALLGDMDLIR